MVAFSPNMLLRCPQGPLVRGSHPPPLASILSCGRTSLQERPWPEYAEGEVGKRRILIRGDAAVAAHLTTAEGWALRAQHLRKCVHGMTKSLFARFICTILYHVLPHLSLSEVDGSLTSPPHDSDVTFANTPQKFWKSETGVNNIWKKKLFAI